MGVRAIFGSTTPAVPGDAGRCDVTLENTGDATEHVRLELVGEAAAWGWVTPPTLTLVPGERAEARISCKVPRAPHPPAGPLRIDLAVVTGGERAVVSGELEVAPFVDVFATLDPQTWRGRGAGRQVLTVENRGNAPLSAVVETEGEAVDVRADPDRIEAGPGRSVGVRLTARADRQRFRGGTTARTFDVVVRPDGPGRPGRVQGSIEVAPMGRMARLALLLLVLAVGGVGVTASVFTPSGGDEPEASHAAVTGASTDCPGRDHQSPDANGIVRPNVKPAFDYTFLFVDDGCHPARFNPCAPIRYVLNRRLASDADVADLQEALGKTSAATGLEFQYAGPSDEDPLTTTRPVRAANGTLTWPPVLIGWAHLGTGESLRPRDAVRADPDVVVGGGGRPLVSGNVITTGILVLNLDAVTDTDTRRPVPHGFGTGVNWGRIMLHELAHVVGLGHVESRTSIMNEALTQQTISSSEWGVGDLIGLRHLGRDAGCLDVPPVDVRGAPR